MSQNKLELLLSLKDKFTGPLTEVKKKLTSSTDSIKRNISSVQNAYGSGLDNMRRKVVDWKKSHVEAFGAIKDEIPGLDRALQLLRNPYVAAAAGAVALGLLFMKAGTAAADFNHQFLEVRNLNLDKTQAQLDKLSNKVVDLSIAEGLDPTATAKAFFDVQSATGKYGREVELITAKVGRFAHATKTDFGEAINGAVKGMINFKFGADQLDAYLTSSAKTVQVGITTFDELARVQTEFAGAAAASGQSFDTANKIFATFTKVSKNVDIAATLTKTAFQGLADPKVVKALGQYGIKMFDANGKFLATDKIISQLVPKLASMSDQDFSKFMGEVGGPEGLRELMNQIKISGDDLLKTFDAFDNTKFNIDEALKNAKGDFNTLKTLVGNQLQGYLIKLGQYLLPPVIKLLDSLYKWLKEAKPYFILTVSFFKNMFDVIKPLLKPLGDLIVILGGAKIAMIALNAVMAMNPFVAAAMGAIALIAAIKTLYENSEDFRASLDGTMAVAKALLPVAGAVAVALANPTNPGLMGMAVGLIKNFDAGAIYDKAHWESLKKSRAARMLAEYEDNESLTPDGEQPTTTTPGNSNPSDDGVSKVVGDSHAARNITINIDSLQRGNVEVYNEKGKGMSETQLQQWFQEMLLRAVRDTELSI